MRGQPSAERAQGGTLERVEGAPERESGNGTFSRSPGVPPSPVNMGPAGASNRKRERAREAQEDRALIARAQAGDKSAFRALVERHQRRAYSIALALVRDENDARDIVQDAFVRVFKSLPTFQGDSSFFTWLYRITTNLSIDLIRKPSRATSELFEERLDAEESADLDTPFIGHLEGSDPAEIVRRREIAASLQTALDALPSYHRAVIVLREIEGLSYEEMAEVMGVSKGTIMSRLFHARQKLQRALADCYGEQLGTERAPVAVSERAPSVVTRSPNEPEREP